MPPLKKTTKLHKSVPFPKTAKNTLELLKVTLEIKTLAPSTLPTNSTNKKNNSNNYKNGNRAERRPKVVYLPCETCGKTNHSTEKNYYGANAANRSPPLHGRSEEQNQVPERANRINSNETAQAAAQKLSWNATFSLPSSDWQTGDYETSTSPWICLAATTRDSFNWYALKLNYYY